MVAGFLLAPFAVLCLGDGDGVADSRCMEIDGWPMIRFGFSACGRFRGS